jgi:hypothetical protein
LILVGLVALALARKQVVRVEVIAFEVSSPVSLDQRARAIGHLLREAPDLCRVELELADSFVADGGSVRALTELQERLSEARVSLSISASAPVALTLRSHGIDASTRGQALRWVA